MIMSVLRTRVYSFVFCTTFSILSLMPVSASAATATEPSLIGSVLQNPVFDVKKAIELAKKASETISELDYFTATEFVLAIPALNQELVINWGFAGSGDLFTALPEAKALLRNGAIAHYDNKPFSIAEFGALLAQDAIANKTKQLEMLQWLSDAEFGAFKVFCLKACLLAKDYRQEKVDAQIFQNELFRLVIRLFLSDTINDKYESIVLSKRLPWFITELVSPEMLTLVDKAWDMISVPAEAQDAQLRTVIAARFTSAEAAECYFSALKKFNQQALSKDEKGVTVFASVTAQAMPTGMPEELYTEAMSVLVFPQLIKVAVADGQTWVALVTKDYSLMRTTKSIISTLVDVLKKYAALRKQIHTSNPAIEQKRAAQQQAAYQQARLVAAFLKTDEGKRSTNRFDEVFKNIKNKQLFGNNKPSDVSDTQLITQLVQKEEQLAAFRALETDLKKVGQPVPADVKSSIKTLEAELAAETNTTKEPHVSFEQRLAQRVFQAAAYRTEVDILTQEIKEKLALIKLLPIAQRKLADLRFAMLEKPQYTVYMSDLELKAQVLLEQNKQAEELYNYRCLQAEKNASWLPDDATRKHIAQLESTVGWLVDNKPNTYWMMSGLMQQNPELTELFGDLSGTDQAYAAVRDLLVNRMRVLAEESSIKEHARVYGYFISKFFPAFLPLFEKVIQNAPAAQ